MSKRPTRWRCEAANSRGEQCRNNGTRKGRWPALCSHHRWYYELIRKDPRYGGLASMLFRPREVPP